MSYRPTHLPVQHGKNSTSAWGAMVAVLGALMLVVGGSWYAFGYEPQWSKEAAAQIQNSRLEACNQKVTLRIGADAAFVAEPRLVCSWLKPVPAPAKPFPGEIPTPKFDSAKISRWVQDGVKMVEKAPVTGNREVDNTGALVKLVSDPVPGVEVADAEVAIADIKRDLEAPQGATAGTDSTVFAKSKTTAKGSPDATVGPASADPRNVEATLETSPANATFKDTVVTAPALYYQPQSTEKWVDVNLTNHTATGYEGTKKVIGPVAMVDGHTLNPTVQGVFKVYAKVPHQVMRGVGWDGDYAEDVPWIAYFDGNYALHGAPSRTSFVYDPNRGSHGCVNLPVDVAKSFYDWVENGTTVVSHL
ncbi:MAG: L,D-transpeptidase [Mobiluncus sp.]|uniref:L,D-transpeptidase n=1 Tax=Mobiluncus sp. TaxID=47293 RepID=UPI00258C8A64|nr:L,D-transpeptidase [Mobiluncus sp.]MCI6583966.1 L,D-transpeptidase [Mobiluncus sp.]